MASKIILTVTKGTLSGTVFVFEAHDTLLFGRQKECHIHLPDDKTVSRHHFLLEVSPPQAHLRDLGSRNGTFVNGVRYGGRQKHESPTEGGRHHYPEVDLYHNDEIRVGETRLHFEVHHQQARQTIYCQQCGRDVSDEVGPEQTGDFLCSRCRERMKNDPAVLLMNLFAQTPAKKTQGIQLADYQILKKLGEGGMGAVYLIAPKVRTQGHEMALKVMSARTAVDPHAKQTFLREIESTEALKHPNIVSFFGSGAEKSTFYFLLEYCQGGSVSNLIDLRGGRLTVAEAGPIMLQASRGLAYAHRMGFVHRDIKPQNILLSGTEGNWQAKIADFGLAKNISDAGLSGLTMSGEGFAGSLLFMARDQILDYKYTKPTSDIWSMGATFYFMLTGCFPRPNRSGADPIDIALKEKAVPLLKIAPELPPALASVIDRALAFHPKDRYSTADDMADALEKALKK